MKRLLDIIGSALLIVMFSPVMLLIAIIVKLDSDGPILFRQRRCGLGGREFHMYKFRTMVVNADQIKRTLVNEVNGPMFKISNDPRITRSGSVLRKWSLDELLQLFNIFIGDMSLVGPRPLATDEMSQNEVWRKVRLSVKPGLTGLWQIKGRGTKKFEDWIKYDIEYVEKQSFLFDLKLLFMTVGSVLRRTGAE